ncbi:MAG: hypothetical protein IAE79_19075, partial [Anaerolinea sp.]|nr:hypothetical protein [Anaerolinea sp.]
FQNVPAAEIVHYGGESTRQVPAESVVNLWRSRAQLYRRHHNKLTITVASWLVAAGMKKKMAQTNDPQLKQAYLQIIDIWKGAK